MLQSLVCPSKENLAFKTAAIVLASAILAAASQFSFLLPYTPILVTMQTMAIFFMGRTLGPTASFLAVLLYLTEGVFGLPVFAMGQSGLAVLLGPKGGFYVGFLLAAWISGWSFKEQNTLKVIGIFFLANSALYLSGLSWLSFFVGSYQSVLLGLVPFVFGDLLKIAAASCIVKATK